MSSARRGLSGALVSHLERGAEVEVSFEYRGTESSSKGRAPAAWSLPKHAEPERPNCADEYESAPGARGHAIPAVRKDGECGFVLHAKNCTNPDLEYRHE